jgi:hypothetical protein
MRNGGFVFVALILGSCGSHTTSLDAARSQFLDAVEDHQACMNATSGEVVINCEPKRLIAEAAERDYTDAMSSGVQEASSLKR